MWFRGSTYSAHCSFLAAFLALCILAIGALPAFAGSPAAISIQGPGIQPQLGFACCDQGVAQMRALFADPSTIADLHALHAQVAVALADFSPERAQVVRMLNEQQIPAIAGLMLQTKDGPYFNAEDANETPAQFAAFEKWTGENNLYWAAVGLDLEPNFAELAALRNHPWRLMTTLIGNSLDDKRLEHAQQIYSKLIRQIQAQGYPVETYSLPFVPIERKLHTTLLDRMLGVPDVRGNENDVMIYTSYARSVGPAVILDVGPNAQGIVVGVTDGLHPGTGFGPLDWDEFSTNLIVASHFTRHVGIYNLEGCVRQGFLPRLEAMDWGGSVVIPASSVSRAKRHVMAFEIALWIAAHFLYFLAAVFLLVILLVWRRIVRKRRLALSD